MKQICVYLRSSAVKKFQKTKQRYLTRPAISGNETLGTVGGETAFQCHANCPTVKGREIAIPAHAKELLEEFWRLEKEDERMLEVVAR